MKKMILTALCCIAFLPALTAGEHPCLFASADGMEAVRQKIATQRWAADAFARIRAGVESYADRHIDNPEWIVSRLAMYWKEGERYTQCYLKGQNWDHGEGDAPVPTVRMPGMRTWNKYDNVPLEERIPYNESGDMLGVNKLNPTEPPVTVPYKESGHMVRGNNVEILTLAENAAFVYAITGEEKFARFAADIFNTWLVGTYYMNPILDPERSCGSAGGWEPGGICGYYDYEQIHDDLALHAAAVYDFLYDYLPAHAHPHLETIGKTTKEVAEEVFKRFIDLGMVRGGKEGNWNVNGWDMILRPVLVLDSDSCYADGKGREYYLHYLLEESTDYHAAIPDMLKNYDAVTGLWPESPGYSFSTIQMLLNWAVLLRGAGVDIIAGNPMLQKAAMAVFPWMDDAADMVVFGDSRGGAANFLTFESLLSYYESTGNMEGAEQVAAALNKGVELNKYNRSDADWTGLCYFVPQIPDAVSGGNERASYSPHHRFITMKNWESSYKMMAALYGGTDGFHLTPNGLALQYYAYGYALAPDAAAYESYWSADHAYHQSPVGSNTILPGYTQGDITIEAMEPMVEAGDFINKHALTPYLNFADVSAGEKRRTVAMVQTAGGGYYVDIFRSDLDDNDYLFHHVGTTMELADTQGQTLPTTPVEHMEKPFHAGYDWLTDIGKTACDDAFTLTWTMPEEITARLWMTAADGREIYLAKAPATTLTKGITPGDAGLAPAKTPLLVVRQEGNNAARHPFVSVYEAYKENRPSVAGVTALPGNAGSAGIAVELADGTKDYIISTTDGQLYTPQKQLSLAGGFGWIREGKAGVESLYLGNGRSISYKNCAIEAGEEVYAAVYQEGGEWHYSADKAISVKIGKKTYKLPAGYNQSIIIK